jgi:hypothetical protein
MLTHQKFLDSLPSIVSHTLSYQDYQITQIKFLQLLGIFSFVLIGRKLSWIDGMHFAVDDKCNVHW